MPYVCNVSHCKCVDVTLSNTTLKWLLLPQIPRLQGKFFDSCQKEFKCFSMWLFWGARYILQQFQKTQFIVRVFEKVTLPRHYKCKFKTKNKDQQFHYSLCYAKQRRLGFFDNSFSAYCSPSVLYTKSQLRIYVHENDWKWKLWKIRKEETLKYRVIMGQKNLKNRFPYS